MVTDLRDVCVQMEQLEAQRDVSLMGQDAEW